MPYDDDASLAPQIVGMAPLDAPDDERTPSANALPGRTYDAPVDLGKRRKPPARLDDVDRVVAVQGVLRAKVPRRRPRVWQVLLLLLAAVVYGFDARRDELRFLIWWNPDPRLLFAAVLLLPAVALPLVRLLGRLTEPDPAVVGAAGLPSTALPPANRAQRRSKARMRTQQATGVAAAKTSRRFWRLALVLLPAALLLPVLIGDGTDSDLPRTGVQGISADQFAGVQHALVTLAFLAGAAVLWLAPPPSTRRRFVAGVAGVVIVVSGASSITILEPLNLRASDGVPGLSATGAPFSEVFTDDVLRGLRLQPGVITDEVPGSSIGPATRGGCSEADLTAAIGSDLLTRLDGCRATLTVTMTGPSAGDTHSYGLVEVQTTVQGEEVAGSLAEHLPADRAAVATGRFVVLVDRDSNLPLAQAFAHALVFAQLGSPP